MEFNFPRGLRWGRQFAECRRVCRNWRWGGRCEEEEGPWGQEEGGVGKRGLGVGGEQAGGEPEAALETEPVPPLFRRIIPRQIKAARLLFKNSQVFLFAQKLNVESNL